MEAFVGGLQNFLSHWIYIGKTYRQSPHDAHPFPDLKYNYLLLLLKMTV